MPYHALRGDAEELTLDLEIEDEDEDHRAAFIACTGGEVELPMMETKRVEQGNVVSLCSDW